MLTELSEDGRAGGREKVCDPVNTCHSVALRDCLGRKNALYKYLMLYYSLLYFYSEPLARHPLTLRDHPLRGMPL